MKKRLWRFGLRTSVGLLVTGLLIVLFHPLLLRPLAGFMTIQDPVEAADFLVPLHNELFAVDDLPFAAADLYRQGVAPQIVLIPTRLKVMEKEGIVPPTHEVWRRVLEAEGVPSQAIITLGGEAHDDAQAGATLAAFLKQQAKYRILVLAAAPISRVSRHRLINGLSEPAVSVRIYPVARRDFTEQNWWKSRSGWVTYFDAYYLYLRTLIFY